jgi:hypothetical protein
VDTEFTTNEGPIISFAASRPGRITYYTKLQYYSNNEIKDKFGSLFTLISRNETDSAFSQIVGVYVGDSGILHASNFFQLFPNNYNHETSTIDKYVKYDEWYKIDILMDWSLSTYSIMLNNVMAVQGVGFSANSVDGVRLSVSRQVKQNLTFSILRFLHFLLYLSIYLPLFISVFLFFFSCFLCTFFL